MREERRRSSERNVLKHIAEQINHRQPVIPVNMDQVPMTLGPLQNDQGRHLGLRPNVNQGCINPPYLVMWPLRLTGQK